MNRGLELDDVRRVVDFITSHAETHAIALPGRIPTHKRDDILLLPSSETKADIYRLYEKAMVDVQLRAVALSSFRSLWRKLVPRIVCARPMTDLCWECQRNNRDIHRSSCFPEEVKEAKLKKQTQHLQVVGKERSYLQDNVKKAKEDYKTAGYPPLGPHPPCSTDYRVHVSFDYAQQVHLPSYPMQPGPLYFLVPRKCGIFGVCMEAGPRQVNYLIDESHCSGKGSNAVISYLHHYFEHYSLGAKDLDLHCDNCSGQNKNKYMLAYLMWRCLTGLNKSITLNFLITGHTKFAPDWCFGLLKQKFRKCDVSSLADMQEVVRKSTLNGVNIPQLVGDENGNCSVPTYDWQTFLVPFSKAVNGIKQYHHFEFSHEHPGRVIMKKVVDDQGPVTENILTKEVGVVPTGKPTIIPSPGLPAFRQWYLFENIRDFCTDSTRDITCPKPTVLKPGAGRGQNPIEAEDHQPGQQPQEVRGRGRGRDGGRGRGRGRGEDQQPGQQEVRGRGRGQGGGRGRGEDQPPGQQEVRGRGRGRGGGRGKGEDQQPGQQEVRERGRGRGSGRGRGRGECQQPGQQAQQPKGRGRPKGAVARKRIPSSGEDSDSDEEDEWRATDEDSDRPPSDSDSDMATPAKIARRHTSRT